MTYEEAKELVARENIYQLGSGNPTYADETKEEVMQSAAEIMERNRIFLAQNTDQGENYNFKG